MLPSTRTSSFKLAFVFGTCLLWFAVCAVAQTPRTLSYQGRLLENTGDQGAVDGTVDLVFSLWTGPASDGTAVQLWTESWSGVALSNGIFSVLLGSNGSPLDSADFQGDSSLFLQLQVDGEILLPRQQLGSAPFAFVDEPANELQDLELSGDQLGLSDSSVLVDLSPYLDDADEQDLSLSDNTLSLTNDPTSVDLSGYLDNTDQQDLSLAGDTLSLTNDPSTVNLAGYLDNTDTQTLGLAGDTLTISGSGSSVNLSGSTSVAGLLELANLIDPRRIVFVSSQTYNGNLGGLAGADASCQSLADAAGLRGTHKAWLSDSSASPSTRFSRFGSFELVDGTAIADDWSDLTDGTIQNGIVLDETGADHSASQVWTNTDSMGTVDSNHCSNWGTTVGAGVVGVAGNTIGGWTTDDTSSCGLSRRLYCFQQSVGDVDDQRLSLVGNELQLTSDDGTDTVDLSVYLDDTDTTIDNQQLSLSGNSLQLTSDDGTDLVDLSVYLDDTDTTIDNQELSVSGNDLQLTSDDGTDTVDLAGGLWSRSGNSGTVDGTDFLGTTDNVTFAIRVNNVERARFYSNDRIVMGESTNSVAARDSVILGGGTPANSKPLRHPITGEVNDYEGPNTIGAGDILSTIGGGEANQIDHDRGFIGGGRLNQVRDIYGTIGGGDYNILDTTCDSCVIAGGWQNAANGLGSTVGGGRFNNAGWLSSTSGGDYATVPGGRLNTATGDFSFAAGLCASATHNGSFVWADSSTNISNSTNCGRTFPSTADHQFSVLATGGIRMATAHSGGTPTAGLELASGASSWSMLSDRNSKEHFQVVDPGQVLDLLAAIPISTWNWKTQDAVIRHMGPMAQDFHAAFGLGESDTRISTIDAVGVALAAVQGLNQSIAEKDARILDLESRLAKLEELLQTKIEH